MLPFATGGVFALSLLGAAEGEACGCTKVHTVCSLIQHHIEMPHHFGTELSYILVYMYMKNSRFSCGVDGHSLQDQWYVYIHVVWHTLHM